MPSHVFISLRDILHNNGSIVHRPKKTHVITIAPWSQTTLENKFGAEIGMVTLGVTMKCQSINELLPLRLQLLLQELSRGSGWPQPDFCVSINTTIAATEEPGATHKIRNGMN